MLFNYIAAYLEPWHSQKQFIQALSGTFSNSHPCSGILRDIKAYLGIIEVYGDIIRNIRDAA